MQHLPTLPLLPKIIWLRLMLLALLCYCLPYPGLDDDCTMTENASQFLSKKHCGPISLLPIVSYLAAITFGKLTERRGRLSTFSPILYLCDFESVSNDAHFFCLTYLVFFLAAIGILPSH